MDKDKEVETAEVKHIFLDIVSYTQNRSIEAQSNIISSLNDIVKNAIKDKKLNEEQIIFIPTGDGMCISLIKIDKPYDIHIELAILILEKLSIYNSEESDKMRIFDLRIGINENIDNIIIDINGNKNISGKGINNASRIEGLCDANQILVGDSVFDRLNQREKYMNSFDTHKTTVKHNVPLVVHQYKNDKFDFLNNNIPIEFKNQEIKTIKELKEITEFEIYYLMVCLENEDFIVKNNDVGLHSYSLQVLLFFITKDIIQIKNITKRNPTPRLIIQNNLQDYFDKLQKMEIDIVIDLQTYNTESINNISKFVDIEFLFVNELGKQIIENKYSNMYDDFLKLNEKLEEEKLKVVKKRKERLGVI